MFALSLIDTLRLAFGQVVYHHKSHSHAASSLARWSRWFRAGETVLMAGVVITSVAAAFGKSYGFTVASAVFASLALVTFLLHVTFDFESTARAHHVCSIRLWHIREEYRALLSDLADGATDAEAARARRDVLMNEVTAIHDSAPPMTSRIFKAARDNSVEEAEELALADGEIDKFLPKSLHGTQGSEAAQSGE